MTPMPRALQGSVRPPAPCVFLAAIPRRLIPAFGSKDLPYSSSQPARRRLVRATSGPDYAETGSR